MASSSSKLLLSRTMLDSLPRVAGLTEFPAMSIPDHVVEQATFASGGLKSRDGIGKGKYDAILGSADLSRGLTAADRAIARINAAPVEVQNETIITDGAGRTIRCVGDNCASSYDPRGSSSAHQLFSDFGSPSYSFLQSLTTTRRPDLPLEQAERLANAAKLVTARAFQTGRRGGPVDLDGAYDQLIMSGVLTSKPFGLARDNDMTKTIVLDLARDLVGQTTHAADEVFYAMQGNAQFGESFANPPRIVAQVVQTPPPRPATVTSPALLVPPRVSTSSNESSSAANSLDVSVATDADEPMSAPADVKPNSAATTAATSADTTAATAAPKQIHPPHVLADLTGLHAEKPLERVGGDIKHTSNTTATTELAGILSGRGSS